MKYTKILSLSIITTLTYLLCSRDIFAQTQTFNETHIPQTMLSSPRSSNQCYDTKNYAFYDKQYGVFYSTFSANSIGNTIRIINTATGQNNVYSSTGAADSSKEFVYNPFGSLSNTNSFVGKNTFVPNFVWKSSIKPANIQSVYVSRQASPTYFVAGSGSTRNQIVGQIVHNIWRRAPYSVTNGGLSYSYVEYPSQTAGTVQLTLGWSTQAGRNRTDNGEYLCNNVYVATCGDGILDNTGQAGGNNKDGKQGIQTVNGFIPWTFPNSFIGEICDSTTSGGVACVNGTVGCCNTTCNDYVTVTTNERCGDEIIQEEGTYYNGDPNNISFESCDDGDEQGDTDGLLNGDDLSTNLCSSTCLPTFAEAFVEVFINE